jgi:hypothetical protein
MRQTLTLLAAASAAVMLGAPATRATPMARAGLDNGVEHAHSVRICDDEGNCWWSSRHHGGGYWDEGRHWRQGWRDRDEDYYGRGEGRRDGDRDYDRDRYERHGYRGDRDDWGRSNERERSGRDLDRDHDRDRDHNRSAHDETTRDHGMKERGGAQTPESKKD